MSSTNNERPVLVQPYMLVGDHYDLNPKFEVEKHLKYFPSFTTTLVLLNILIFFWSMYTFVMNPSDNLVTEGRYLGYWLTKDPIRMLTSSFLHAGFLHLFGNIAMIYIVGIVIEHLYGPFRLFLVFLATMFASSIATGIFYDSDVSTVGASGVAFGLVGFLITFYVKYFKKIFWRHKVVGIVLTILSLHSIYQGFTTSFVNNAAHAGGFLCGLVLGSLIQPLFMRDLLDQYGHRKDLTKIRKYIYRSIGVVTSIIVISSFIVIQSRLTPHGNISFRQQVLNTLHFFMNSGLKSPNTIWSYKYRTAKKNRPSFNKPEKSKSSNSDQAATKVPSKKETSNEEDYFKQKEKWEKDQGKVCPICVKGQKCNCQNDCAWTYLHHYADEKCRVKITTTVWGPNTGSPFRMGWNKKGFCKPAAGRYYAWEHPRYNCFSPLEK